MLFFTLNLEYFIYYNSRIKIIKILIVEIYSFYYLFEIFIFDLSNYSRIIVSTFQCGKGWFKEFQEPVTKNLWSEISCTSEGQTLREAFIEALIYFTHMSQKRLTNFKHWARVVPMARAASASWIRKPEFSFTRSPIWTLSPAGDHRINSPYSSKVTYTRTTWPWFSPTISR